MFVKESGFHFDIKTENNQSVIVASENGKNQELY
jgi:hypothetical protein